jgi:hypothetical protein
LIAIAGCFLRLAGASPLVTCESWRLYPSGWQLAFQVVCVLTILECVAVRLALRLAERPNRSK